jgi:lipid A 3-O-deacylase
LSSKCSLQLGPQRERNGATVASHAPYRRARIGGAILAASIGCSHPIGAQEANLLGISELKLGALYHDVPGLWAGFAIERPAADANVEVLFTPWARAFGGHLRPALGATINLHGETSKAYADLRWQKETSAGIFFALGMGLAVHNGNTELTDPARKALGSTLLFHPSAEVGYRLNDRDSISIFADHISNGFTRRFNEGMDTVGIRYGRRLGPISSESVREMPAGDFAGFYIGALAGYQHESVDWFAPTTIRAANNGFALVGIAGYNWQSGQGVFGLELDGSPSRRSFASNCDLPGISCRLDLGGVYGVRARFGWVVDKVMFYGSGGVALTPWDSTVVDLGTSHTLDHVRGLNYGVTVGAGIEYKLSQNLSVRGEINHYGVDGWSLTLPAQHLRPTNSKITTLGSESSGISSNERS